MAAELCAKRALIPFLRPRRVFTLLRLMMSLRNDARGSAEMRSVPELEDKAFEYECLLGMASTPQAHFDCEEIYAQTQPGLDPHACPVWPSGVKSHHISSPKSNHF